MAKQQYRIYTPGQWTSGFGHAFLAIQNISGSGKKITLRQLEAQVCSANDGSATTGACPTALYRCTTPVTGDDMAAFSGRADTNTTIPSTVVVRRRAIPATYAGIVRRVNLARRVSTAATVNDARFQNRQHGLKRNDGLYRSAIKQTAVEPLYVRQNEAYALRFDPAASTAPYTNPLRVNVMLSIDGKMVNWDFVTMPMPGESIVSVENTSTNVVEILQIATAEVGTSDTPTIRVVPIGQIRPQDFDDTTKQSITPMPMDSAYGSLSSSVCRIYSDVGIGPYGVPEVYINPGSAGSPKDMNYLHTRDFDGPMYRNFLPEMCAVRTLGTSAPDMLGTSYAHRWGDLLMRRKSACAATPVVLNPGEGVALVSSAETAVGVQAAWSGWPLLFFGAMLDIEPAVVPTITVTGMIDGSRYRIERVSDSSVVTDGTAGVSGQISYVYTTEDTPLNLRLKVRKATSAPYYKPYEITFNLTSAGITLPVSQISDA